MVEKNQRLVVENLDSQRVQQTQRFRSQTYNSLLAHPQKRSDIVLHKLFVTELFIANFIRQLVLKVQLTKNLLQLLLAYLINAALLFLLVRGHSERFDMQSAS
jgi:hypothetical protein